MVACEAAVPGIPSITDAMVSLVVVTAYMPSRRANALTVSMPKVKGSRMTSPPTITACTFKQNDCQVLAAITSGNREYSEEGAQDDQPDDPAKPGNRTKPDAGEDAEQQKADGRPLEDKEEPGNKRFQHGETS